MGQKKYQLISFLLYLIFEGCALIPRNLEEYESNVKKITFVSPVGAGMRSPNGVEIYLFRTIMLQKRSMIGIGVDFAQVMYMIDSETFVSLLAHTYIILRLQLLNRTNLDRTDQGVSEQG